MSLIQLFSLSAYISKQIRVKSKNGYNQYCFSTPEYSKRKKLSRSIDELNSFRQRVFDILENSDQKGMLEFLNVNSSLFNISFIHSLLYAASKKSVKIPGSYILKFANRIASSEVTIPNKYLSGFIYSLKNIAESPKSGTIGMKSSHSLQTNSNIETNILISVLSDKLQETDGRFSSQEIAMMLYGLQNLTSDSEEALSLVSEVTDKIRSIEFQFNIQEIGTSLYGLKGMHSSHPIVRDLIRELNQKLVNSSPNLDAQAIGSALYGLRKMSCEYEELRTLISILTHKIISSEVNFNSQTVGNALYGLQNMSSKHSEVLVLLTALADKIDASTCDLTAQGIANALYGLQNMSSDKLEVRQLLFVLTKKIRTSSERLQFSSWEVGMALYGLQGLNSECKEVQDLLQELILKFNLGSDPGQVIKLHGFAVGSALYGLQSMSSEVLEVQNIVRVLNEIIRHSQPHLDAQSVSNSLYGLKRMSSDVPEVMNLIRTITELTRKNDSLQFEVETLAGAFFGLQKMRSDHPEILDLIQVLTENMYKSDVKLTDKAIGMILYGLKSMNADSIELRRFIRVLISKIESSPMAESNSDKDGTGHWIGMGLFGLQGMSSDIEEIRMLLVTLRKRLLQQQQQQQQQGGKGNSGSAIAVFDGQTASNALYGLQMMTCDHVEVKQLLHTLVSYIDTDRILSGRTLGLAVYGLFRMRCDREPVKQLLEKLTARAEVLCGGIQDENHHHLQGASTSRPIMNISDLLVLYQSVALGLRGLPGLDSATYNRLDSLRLILLNKLQQRVSELNLSKLSSSSGVERRVANLVQNLSNSGELFANSCQVSVNEFIYGFEADIVIRFNNGIIVNIEVDGPKHGHPGKSRFSQLRDELLTEYGVKVERMKTAQIEKLKQSDFEEYLLELLERYERRGT